MALSGLPESVQPAPAAAATATTTVTVAANFESLVLDRPPPLDPNWCQYEKEANLPMPRVIEPPLERQPLYAAECRELSASMRAPGTRDEHLSAGIVTRPLTAPSSLDGYDIPLLEYSCDAADPSAPKAAWVVVYIHGGGLHIGEADSEDLSCRRIVKEAQLAVLRQKGAAAAGGNVHEPPLLYSIGYRLMPLHPATTCLADCVDGFRRVHALHPRSRILLVGSSSGGELAALVAQEVQDGLHGVLLRCPVTSDAFAGLDPYVPAALRPLHTSSTTPAFETSLLGPMRRLVPRDGLSRMPLEAPADVLRRLPPHWIQVCTNDMLYSDGVCYAKALELAGVTTRVSVLEGWPHTFWLRTPWMPEALEAERVMLDGMSWVSGV